MSNVALDRLPEKHKARATELHHKINVLRTELWALYEALSGKTFSDNAKIKAPAVRPDRAEKFFAGKEDQKKIWDEKKQELRGLQRELESYAVKASRRLNTTSLRPDISLDSFLVGDKPAASETKSGIETYRIKQWGIWETLNPGKEFDDDYKRRVRPTFNPNQKEKFDSNPDLKKQWDDNASKLDDLDRKLYRLRSKKSYQERKERDHAAMKTAQAAENAPQTEEELKQTIEALTVVVAPSDTTKSLQKKAEGVFEALRKLDLKEAVENITETEMYDYVEIANDSLSIIQEKRHTLGAGMLDIPEAVNTILFDFQS